MAAGFVVLLALALAGSGAPEWTGRLEARSIRVIDGDTVRTVSGERIRILNIDAPELPPRAACAYEAQLALRARERLEEMLRSARAVRFAPGPQDRDRYGRALRYMEIDGVDVGQSLIAAGLAQPWVGRRAQWC